MRHLSDWLQRLETSSPPDLRELLFRGVVPGRDGIQVGGTLIAIQPIRELTRRPGDMYPTSSVLLRFLDRREAAEELPAAQALAVELGAALSLASGRRFEVALEHGVSVPERPKEVVFVGLGAVDRRLHGLLPVDEMVESFLDLLSRVRSLSAEDLEALSAASELHYGSLLLSDRDARVAYVLLVAALEVLSQQFGPVRTDWTDWEEAPSWDDLLASLSLDEQGCERVREKLLKNRHLRLKATFRSYVADGLPDTFWDETWREWQHVVHVPGGRWGEVSSSEKPVATVIPKDRQVIYRSLGKTYDLRSGIVHAGKQLAWHETALREGIAVSEKQPVPYAALRAMLVAMINRELENRTSPQSLPDFKSRETQ